MPPAILYEVLFACVIGLMTLISALVVIPSRLLLRPWKALWPKIYLIHTINILVLYLLVPSILSLSATLSNVGLVVGTVIYFGLIMMFADGLRTWRQQVLMDKGRPVGASPWILFLAVASAAVVVTHATVRADEGRAALAESQWNASVAKHLMTESPSREILPVMRQIFPLAMEDIVERYAKEARSEFDSQPQGFLWPKFPLDDVYKLIVAKRDTIFNAPDAQLSALIRAQADMADLYRLMPKSCASAAVGGGPVQEENSDSPLSEAQVKKLGVVTAASLEAIQAGFTNYLTRPANGAEILDAKQSFVRTFAKSIDLSDDDPVRALPESDRCEFFLAYLNWLASLPPNQAAAFVSYAYDANSSSRPVYAETPYSLIPLAVVEPNAELMRSEPARD